MIGDKIKKLRKNKGISQKDFAKILGIPVSTLANYENNHREPNVAMIKEIAKALNVSSYDLISNESVFNGTGIISKKLNEIFKSNNNIKSSDTLIISDEYKTEMENIMINSFLDFTSCIGINKFKELPNENILNIINNKLLFDILMQLFELEHSKVFLANIKKQENLMNENNKEETKEIETIAAHLDDKNVTPEKMERIKNYIDALFDEEE